MKSAKEWMDLYDPAWADDHGPTVLTLERVREIQRDALLHAAAICRRDGERHDLIAKSARMQSKLLAEAIEIQANELTP